MYFKKYTVKETVSVMFDCFVEKKVILICELTLSSVLVIFNLIEDQFVT